MSIWLLDNTKRELSMQKQLPHTLDENGVNPESQN